MGVIASHGYGIPKSGVKGGWTASFGFGNFPWSTLLMKGVTRGKKTITSTAVATMLASTVESIPMTADTTETSMIAGTSEADMGWTSGEQDTDSSSAQESMDYASREGIAPGASSRPDMLEKYTINPDLTAETLDPAEKDEDDG